VIKLNYRPEIDCLRAIAVGAVIIYHAKIYILGDLLFPGGFLGVDIFFVISGYLISSLIFQELENGKKFSFKRFYERRARRILPALIFVILICLPFSWIYILPTSFIDFSKSILFSLGFGSNFYFYFTGLEYGAESGLLKPLLHTWSLAVEEQFYLIFPLIFFLIFKFFYNFRIKIIFAMILASFIFAIYFSNINPSLNFYLIFSRIWEILIGTLIYFFEKFKDKETSHFQSNLFVTLGLMAILFSFINIDSSQGHPNLKSAIPILSVGLIIYYSKKDAIVVKFLSNKFFTGIGLISYSLYLWHYPIFAFSRIGYLTKNIYHEILVALSILILSILTYYLIEKPFRSNQIVKLKHFIFSIMFTFFILISFSFIIIANKGFETRHPLYGKFNLDNLKYSQEVRIFKYETGTPEFKDNIDKKKILIFGNSHGRDFFNIFITNKELFSKYQFSMLDGQIHCLTGIVDKKLCDKSLSNKLHDIFLESEYFVISQNWAVQDLEKIDEVVMLLKEYNKKIIFTSQHPDFYFKNSRNIIDEFYLKNKRLPDTLEKEKLEIKKFNSELEKSKNINKFLKKYAKLNNIKFLDKKDFLCRDDQNRCYVLTNDNDKIHLDAAHITISGAKFFGKIVYSTDWFNLD
jgi:peptidoglycan/LPS O-acetylase OafA/YrhL